MEERLYDLIFIVRPATPEDEIKKVLSGIEHTCAEKGGKIEKTEHWGTRKLAYRIAKASTSISRFAPRITNSSRSSSVAFVCKTWSSST